MQQHSHTTDISPEEAASILGIDVKGLAALLERYGVGRHYEGRQGNEFVYERAEIETVKRRIEEGRIGRDT